MKIYLLAICLFLIIPGITSQAQDVQFPPAILSAGGGTTVQGEIHVSKWRLEKLNVFFIDSEDLKSAKDFSSQLNDARINKGKVEVFPNPVNDWLNISFSASEKREYKISLYDMSGKKLLLQKTQKITSDQVIQLNLSGISPALYLLNISASDYSVNKNFKINKY